MPFRRFILAAIAALATQAFATPQPRNATDLWINYAESGWGLNVFHQGDTLFASLFVYGPDGQPKWYTASALTGGPSVYTGALIEATGPWFGGSFNPAAVTRRTVGTMTFTIGDTLSTLDYTVDGVRVTKQVSRFTFDRTNLASNYVGVMYQPGAGEAMREQNLVVSDDGSTVTMVTQSASQPMCTWTGTHGQNGQYEIVSGSYSCGSRSGTWSMTVDPMMEGFAGSFASDGVDGRIAATRRGGSNWVGPGYRNELFFPPDEPGWGLNIIEQGEKLFGTLFVYDSQGRPRWYSISNLERHDGRVERVDYIGGIVESTGPYFGTSFNASAVTRRSVGGMTLTTRADGTARVFYSIDGTTVTKELNRYAFRKNDFSGSYTGHVAADNENPGGPGFEAVNMTIDDSGSTFTMQTSSARGTCTYTAPMSQMGHLRNMTGSVSCSDGRSGAFTISRAAITFQGFAAKFQGPGILYGHIEGVRR